ncbi:MAG: hypothetical protein KDC53_08415 [Saprospiraceae bacterium]|nr:hypothetical protein [Saprospiraceae bacterium]
MKRFYYLLIFSFVTHFQAFCLQKNHEITDSSELTIGLTILDIIDVNDEDETITIEFFFTLNWLIDSLRNTEIAYSEEVVPWIEMQYLTELNSSFEKKIPVDGHGIASFHRKIIGTLRHSFDFTNFPFDHQDWKLVFFNVLGQTFRIRADTHYMGLHEDFIDPPTWRTNFTGVEEIKLRGPGPDIRGLAYNFEIKRNSTYYIWKVLVPIGLIVLMSWGVFWIRPEEIAAQLTVSVTAILTLVAFQFSVSQLVPPLSYMTTLDKYTVGADFLVFLAFLESLITSYQAQAQVGRHQFSAKIDRASRWIFPISFIFFILMLFYFKI